LNIIKSIFSKIFKGEQGEADVFEAIGKILNSKGDENYYLIPKATLDDAAGSSKEIDLLLLHPVLGIYVIEVKNWSNLNQIDSANDPYEQVKIYQRMLLAKIQSELKKVPINVEYRVIFPSVSKDEADKFYEKNPSYKNFKNHTFFKDDLANNNDIFARFFHSSVADHIPNKKEFLKISQMLVSQSKLKQKIIPIITKDEIMFFDRKQLSIMSGYTGGFRVIRGVAGTGKTMILANFVANRLERDDSEKFLVLCFNKNLAENIRSSFGDRFMKQSIAVYSIISLLNRIGFDEAKLGIDEKTSLDEKYKIFETDEAITEFRAKFSAHLAKHPIDYVLCDETQDMPAGFMRVIYEEIKDCVFFIDEAQKFYPYTMNSIADIFHHPKFERIDMRGRVKNLKNVYRTPSNIARCAFEILQNDSTINTYYKNSFYLDKSFLEDIECVLQDGSVNIRAMDDFSQLRGVLESLPVNETSVVLSNSKKSVEAIKEYALPRDKNIDVLTMQSIKGLEAQNIVIHNFLPFLQTTLKNDRKLFFRKIYVLLTRSKENLYVSIPEKLDENLPAEIKNVIETIKKYASIAKAAEEPSKDEKTVSSKIKLASIKPVLRDIKDGAELVVAGSELFAIIAGLFG